MAVSDVTLASITDISAMLRMDRRTILKRLANMAPVGKNGKADLYVIADVMKAIYSRDESAVEIDEMIPTDRKAYFQSKREELKYLEESGTLYQINDIMTVFSVALQSLRMGLLLVPDRAERKYSLPPESISMLRESIDTALAKCAIDLQAKIESIIEEE